MSRRIPVALMTLTVLVALACNPLSGLGGGGEGPVANLWPDVPAYPGAEKVDAELPLFARLAVEAASRALTAGAGDFGFISFSTSDSAEDVMSFYTVERMAAEGWRVEEAEMGCSSGTEETEGIGAMCAFGKEGSDESSALFIVIVPGSEGAVTNLFFVRIDANPEAMATAAAQ
jgi:hypothetical protein